MLTSKQRAELRSQANTLETTLMVGKDGVTEAVIEEADKLLTARELIKGKVLETAFMTAREVSDEICQATGADGVSCVGNKFVIYRFSDTAFANHQSGFDAVGLGAQLRSFFTCQHNLPPLISHKKHSVR